MLFVNKSCYYMLEMKTENCTTLNMLEGLEGNVKEIFDGSAFKVYWKVCTKNGDWNKVERSVVKHGL